MPNNDGTLRDILQGFNSMQARLGLTPGSQHGQGIQPLSTPVRHPGEVSQEMSVRLMQSTQATAQSIQQIQMMQQPNAMAFMPPGGIGGGSAAGGQFGRQFQQRMGQIESGYQDPYRAQQMSQQMGQPGFMTLPSPTFMTAPSMGVFRPGFQPPPPISMARTPPFIQTPMTPQLPSPMFQTPGQMQHAQAQVDSNQMFAGAMAGIPAAGRIATGLGGMAGGAALGQRMGGGAGALMGAIGGGLLGFGPAGGMVEGGIQSALQPAVERRAMGLQMQSMSRNFVTSGSQLDASGRGLSMRAGIQTANGIRSAVNNEDTGGFNMRDMMGITSMAGNMGMMDMAQNSEQIVGQAKNIAKGLSAFMQLANEPDVRRAMQQMSQMRQMGMTVPETTQSMQNAQKFARMAGTNVADLSQTAGMPGAMTFQQMGMSAGLGFNVGMGAGGMARQAVASGAFTPGQLSMAGGMRGVQQQMTEAAGATLGINFPMMSMLTRNAQGKLSIDREKAQRIASGDVSLTQQAGMAQENVERLGGAKVITELSTRLNELRDQLGKTLGPQGTLLMTLGQAKAMQGELGGSVSLGGALRAMGLNPQQARTMETMAQSPQFWRGMQQQMQVQKDEARQEEASRREQARGASTLTAQMQRGLRPLGRLATGIGRAVSGAYDNMSQWFSDQQSAQSAAEGGGAFVRQRDRLSVASQRTQRQLNRFTRSGAYDRMAQTFDQESARNAPLNEALHAVGFGGDESEDYSTIGSFFGLTKGIETTTAFQAANTVGGFGGTAGAGMTARVMEMSPQIKAAFVKQARSVAKGAQSAQQGRDLTYAAASRLNRESAKAYQEYSRAEGGSAGSKGYAEAKDGVVGAILSDLRSKSSWMGDSAQSDDDRKALAIKHFTKTMGAAGAQKFVSEQWGKGLGQSIARDVGKRVTDKERGAWEKSQEGAGFAGFEAGKNLERSLDKLEDFEDATRELVGANMGINVSDEAYKKFADSVMSSSTHDTLANQVAALEAGTGGSGATGEINEAARGAAYKKLIATVGSEKAMALMDKARSRVKGMDKEVVSAYQRSAYQMSGKDAKATEKAMAGIKDRMQFERSAAQVKTGIAEIGEKVEAFRGLKGAGAGQLKDAMRSVLEDSSQSDALAKVSPEAAKAVQAFKDAGDDKDAQDKAAMQLRGALQARGAASAKGRTFGGRGVGGAREAGIDKQMGTVEKLAASLSGNAQEDFARTVPLFAKASAQFHEATKKQAELVEKQSLLNKLL